MLEQIMLIHDARESVDVPSGLPGELDNVKLYDLQIQVNRLRIQSRTILSHFTPCASHLYTRFHLRRSKVFRVAAPQPLTTNLSMTPH
ncbi:hypothetical protein ABKN59_002820 [Abortiporus biennis]